MGGELPVQCLVDDDNRDVVEFEVTEYAPKI